METPDTGEPISPETHPVRNPRRTRGQALRTAIAGGSLAAVGGLLGARSRTGASAAAPSRQRDAEILSFLLLLEHVQAGFYEEALQRGRLTGELREFATTVGAQEREHVDFLRRRAGRRAQARPDLDFGDATANPQRFRDTAVELEEAAAAAYIGQGPNLTRDAVGDVARIVSVEARHAAWIRDLAGQNPAPRAADPAKTADATMAALRRRGFVR